MDVSYRAVCILALNGIEQFCWPHVYNGVNFEELKLYC